MANPHSTRLKAETFPNRTHRARLVISGARQARSHALFARAPLRLNTATRPAAVPPKWMLELQQIAQALGGIYSSCVTAQLALLGQNAERDRDIERALRMHVSDPVSRQIEKLDAVVRELRNCPDDASSERAAGT